MKGFGQPREFYDGVKVRETFEHDFLPVEGATEFEAFYAHYDSRPLFPSYPYYDGSRDT